MEYSLQISDESDDNQDFSKRGSRAKNGSFESDSEHRRSKKKKRTKSKKKRSKKSKKKDSRSKKKSSRRSSDKPIIRLPAKSRFSDFKSESAHRDSLSRASKDSFYSVDHFGDRAAPTDDRQSTGPEDGSRKQSLLSNKITSITMKNNMFYDLAQPDAAAYSSRHKDKFRALEKLQLKQRTNAEYFRVFSHVLRLDRQARLHQESLIAQVRSFTKLSGKYRVEWINLKSCLDSPSIAFLSENDNRLVLSNVTSFGSCESLLGLLNSVIERDLLEIKWTLSSVPGEELLIQVDCFDPGDRLKLVQNAEVRALLLENKIRAIEGHFAEPPREPHVTLSPASRKRRLAVFLAAVLVVCQKRDPFVVLPLQFKQFLFLANFDCIEFVYFRLVVWRLLRVSQAPETEAQTERPSAPRLSKLCSIEELNAKLGEVAGPSRILRRIRKDLRKHSGHLTASEVLFFSKENHDFDVSNLSHFSGFEDKKRSKASDEPVTEDKLFLKFCSKLNRELEKSLRRSQSEHKSRAKKLRSRNSAEAKPDPSREWDLGFWADLHGPHWLHDRAYIRGLISYYKSNPLDRLMSLREKRYETIPSPNGQSGLQDLTTEDRELLSRKYFWVKDDEQTLQNFELSSIYPENLKFDESHAKDFTPFRFTPLHSLAPVPVAGVSTSGSDLPGEAMPDSAPRQMFWVQSEPVLKGILKFFKKNQKGISKEPVDDMLSFFESLSVWHQKCLVAVLPFGYCAHKDYSLVLLIKNKHIAYCGRYILEDQSRLGSSLVFLGKTISSVPASQSTYKEQAREVFSRLKFYCNLWNDVLCNLSKDQRLSPKGQLRRAMCLLLSVSIVRVVREFSVQFDRIADALERGSAGVSAQDDHEFLVEITSNPNSSVKTPQTWLGTYRGECLSFVQNYLIMWRNKGFVTSDLCRSFDCESERKPHFDAFARGLADPTFAALLENEYFIDWPQTQADYWAKVHSQGLRRSIKLFVDLEKPVETGASRAYYCKIKRFQEEAHQLRNSAIERGREEGLGQKDSVLKAGLMKAGFVQEYLDYLERETDTSLPPKRASSVIDREVKALERFLYLSQKSLGGVGGSKKRKSALKEISHMMKYSNNMENNIKHLDIKRVLEQEFAEKSTQVEAFSELDDAVSRRFGSLLAKRDSDFFGKVAELRRTGRKWDK